jgi:FkbM family methyltransferase
MKPTIQRFVQAARCRLGIGPSVVRRTVLGRDVLARYEVVHERPDHDDGWVTVLIHQCRDFLDVGCNVERNLLISTIDDPKRPMVGVEANPKALAFAAETLILNGASSRACFVLAFAGASDSDEIDFWTVGSGAAGSRYIAVAQTAYRLGKHFRVRTGTLESIVSDLGLGCDFVKIDVEGAEDETLAGARKFCSRDRPRLMVELHTWVGRTMAETGGRVLECCSGLGHDAYYLPERRRVEGPQAFAQRGRCHLLLLPSEQTYPNILKRIPQRTSVERTWAVLRDEPKGETE